MSKLEMESNLLGRVDFLRIDANRGLDGKRKAELGQFMTPASVARLMASMLDAKQKHIRLLDAGAGVGSLTAAAVAVFCLREKKPESISATVFEIDPHMIPYLKDSLRLCEAECKKAGIEFSATIIEGDFLESAVDRLNSGLFKHDTEGFNCAILNPPYKKINVGSRERRLLRTINADSTNIYTGFLAAATQLLEQGGEMVAITPRSFCNGTYFKNFRTWFLREMALDQLYVFESRQNAFKEDAVLQENVIMRSYRQSELQTRGKVTILSGYDADDESPLIRTINYAEVVKPNDPQLFIHIAADDLSSHIVSRMENFTHTLSDLGLTVSTGKVVDFRVKEYLREKSSKSTIPLIWVFHFKDGYVAWPKGDAKKPGAIENSTAIVNQFVPNEEYVLVKRFSAKEEKRRVVAAVYDSSRIEAKCVGLENHLNYYHKNGRGMELTLARGLAGFLNSTLVDSYFRMFSGHTQVNATDLRNIKYPNLEQLKAIGEQIGDRFPEQAELDKILEKELGMAESSEIEPIHVSETIERALFVIKCHGLPRQQSNERSALTMLALLGIKPELDWSKASQRRCGITPMMDFFCDHYGNSYKPNTRETLRRQSAHPFLDAALIVANPDKPECLVNSSRTVDRIDTSAFERLQGFRTKTLEDDLNAYLSTVDTLKQKYAQETEIARIPVTFPHGLEPTLSPADQNVLVKEIVDQFAPGFCTLEKFIYVGETDEKYANYDRPALAALGVELDSHGNMPDVIIHYTDKYWLLLIEAITSHGRINSKRQQELKTLFGKSSSELVYVTTFLSRKAMIKYLNETSRETPVWVADSPTHMIDFNGKRLLGPYPE